MILILTGIVIVALIIFVVNRNQKDKKELEDILDNDYPKPKKHEEKGEEK